MLVLLHLLTALGCGVMAGLFFAFSAFVMQALGRLPPAQGIAAMQAINRGVMTPAFALLFWGTPLLCVAVAATSAMRWGEAGTAWLAAGAALHVLGNFLVTMLFNLPLNTALGAVDPGSEAGARLWARYLRVWTAWNHVRTATGLAALAAIVVAIRLGAGGQAG